MVRNVLMVILLFGGTCIYPQDIVEKCGTMEMDALLREEFPNYETREDFEKWLAPKIEAYKENRSTTNKSGELLGTIPMVVHVIHNSTDLLGIGRNISNAQIVSQIEVLNEDFTRTNMDTSDTPAIFKGVAADIGINFCLAKVDPDGNVMSEPGVNRIDATTIAGLGNSTSGYAPSAINTLVKPVTQWDPEKYMNIWVFDLQGGTLGLAPFPSSSGLSGLPSTGGPAERDGIMIDYKAFGRVGNVHSIYSEGRTATHEIGHWLGLVHIWGDQVCGSDLCDDTPTQEWSHGSCAVHPSPSCGNSGDMFMNFMDYSPGTCLNLFTEDQKARMVTVLQNSPRRKELLTSNVCDEGVGIRDVKRLDHLIEIYPNPSEGILNITLKGNGVGGAEAFIYNIHGKLIGEGNVKSKKIQIDLTDEPAGVYMVHIKTDKGLSIQKVTVHK